MIEILVDRLRWPAGLVRERAATQLSERLAAGADDASRALLAWTANQELESLAAVGLLPFIHAAREADTGQFPTGEIAAACEARSVLSELYLAHLDDRYEIRLDLTRHSGTPPDSWRPHEVGAGVRDVDFENGLRERLRRISQRFLVSVERQFDFELAALRGRYRASSEGAYMAAGNYDTGHYRSWNPVSLEIIISAYLRALAWAIGRPGVSKDEILAAAAFVSPVDLGLWAVKPTVSPDWWPRLASTGREDDVEHEVSAVLRKLHDSIPSWRFDEGVLLAAGGCIAQTNLRQHELEIRAFFHRIDGPEQPQSEDLFTFLNLSHSAVSQASSPLRFEGPLAASGEARRLDDWVVLPCSGSTHPLAIIRWQGWRGVRALQCPSPHLVEGETRAVCQSESIDYICGDELVARWSDWADNLSAFGVRELPHASGWVLTAPRSVVDAFAGETGMTLAWAWELTTHFREYAHGDFTSHRMHGDYGATRVVRL